MTAREMALKSLIKCEKEGTYSNIELKNELKNSGLIEQDRALFKQLFYGTMERKYLLDYYISKISTIKTHKLSPYVLNILRIAFYQILFLDKIPESAACNEAVKMAKTYSKSSFGYVNAVIRNFLRTKDSINLPDIENDFINHFSIKYSLKKWIVELFVKQYGNETAAKIIIELSKQMNINARINTLKTNFEDLKESAINDDIKINICDIVDNAVTLDFSRDIETSAPYKKGLFHLQGLASQVCCHVLSAKPEQILLDVCAAPGGKTFTLAQYMKNSGQIYAFDIHNHKMELIEQGAKRLGITNIKTCCADATEPFDLPTDFADRILCDVPCSNLGIMAKKPDTRYKKFEEVKQLPEIQLKILNNASKHLKKDGLLVYSTCTLNNEENQNVTDKFLEQNSDFEYAHINNYLPLNLKSQNYGHITLLPNIHGTDGFFIALLKKKNG